MPVPTFHEETGLKAKLAIIGYSTLAGLPGASADAPGLDGAPDGRGIPRAVRPGLGARTDGYPYYIQWTGAWAAIDGARRFTPACPMLFIYGRRKPFMFHSPPGPATWRPVRAAGSRLRYRPLGDGRSPDAFRSRG